MYIYTYVSSNYIEYLVTVCLNNRYRSFYLRLVTHLEGKDLGCSSGSTTCQIVSSADFPCKVVGAGSEPKVYKCLVALPTGCSHPGYMIYLAYITDIPRSLSGGVYAGSGHHYFVVA